MYFYNLIKNLSDEKEILLFVDMDGVIASYDAGKPLVFSNKRPLKENIAKIESVSKLPNVELRLLSICRKDFQIKEKNIWLDTYAPFFNKDNRVIISKESLPENISSSDIKLNYLRDIQTNKQIVLLDDDNSIINSILKNAKNIIVLQDSELID